MMTWLQLAELGYHEWAKIAALGTDVEYCFPWSELQDGQRDAWVGCVKAIYNAAAGDLAERIGREGL